MPEREQPKGVAEVMRVMPFEAPEAREQMRVVVEDVSVRTQKKSNNQLTIRYSWCARYG